MQSLLFDIPLICSQWRNIKSNQKIQGNGETLKGKIKCYKIWEWCKLRKIKPDWVRSIIQCKWLGYHNANISWISQISNEKKLFWDLIIGIKEVRNSSGRLEMIIGNKQKV